MTTNARRKNYSISPEQSRLLAHTALKMNDELEKRVHKQMILGVLIETLAEDEKLYRKVLAKVKKA